MAWGLPLKLDHEEDLNCYRVLIELALENNPLITSHAAQVCWATETTKLCVCVCVCCDCCWCLSIQLCHYFIEGMARGSGVGVEAMRLIATSVQRLEASNSPFLRSVPEEVNFRVAC